MKPLAVEQCTAPTVDGQAVVYQAVGQGPHVLFCSGLAASWLGFRPQMAHLSAAGFRCLAWDYRGLFRDRAPGLATLGVADHARDAVAILEHERAGPVAVIGWSLGVQVALQLFAHTPEKVASLVLINGGAIAGWSDAAHPGPLRTQYPRVLSTLARAPELLELLLRQAATSPEAITWMRRLGLAGKGIDHELLGEILRKLRSVEGAALLALLAHMSEVDLRSALPNIDVPTLVIGGDRDPFTSRYSLEQLVNSVRGAEYLLLPGGTHYVQLDHAEHVNLRIQKFFNERGYG
jgi:pimeloyl-ACP methyl ester carboxylesterase